MNWFGGPKRWRGGHDRRERIDVPVENTSHAQATWAEYKAALESGQHLGGGGPQFDWLRSHVIRFDTYNFQDGVRATMSSTGKIRISSYGAFSSGLTLESEDEIRALVKWLNGFLPEHRTVTP